MPFTPFHFGPGALVKAVMPSKFSFQVFVLSQVLIDIEPALGLFLGWEVLHGPTHTWPGAIAIALLTYVAWRGWERYRPKRFDMPSLQHWMVAGSALFGTLSHVWIDSQFHVEMARLTPSLLKLWKTADVSTSIEIDCMTAAGIAIVIFGLRALSVRLLERYRVGRTTQ